MKSTIITAVATLSLLQISAAAAQSTEATQSTPQESSALQQSIEQQVDTTDPMTTDEFSSEEVEQLEAEVKALEAEMQALQESSVGEDTDVIVEEELEIATEQATEVLDDESSNAASPLPVEQTQEVDAMAVEEEITSDSTDEATYYETPTIDETMAELSGEETYGLNSDISNPHAYNFERPIPQEGDIFIPVLSGAKVFAEFIDSLPAVVNYYTYALEDEIIAFYSENYGDPVDQERKRGRLTLTYYVDDVSTRVVISQQDDYRQVDVLQESAAL